MTISRVADVLAVVVRLDVVIGMTERLALEDGHVTIILHFVYENKMLHSWHK